MPINKRGNYFIAMYDLEDNYITEFNSIEECALYFNKSKKDIRDYIFRKKKIKNNFKLYKFEDIEQNINYKNL